MIVQTDEVPIRRANKIYGFTARNRNQPCARGTTPHLEHMGLFPDMDECILQKVFRDLTSFNDTEKGREKVRRQCVVKRS